VNKSILALFFAPIFLGFMADVSAFQELAEVSLEPMEKPSASPFVTGAEVHWLKNGVESTHYYVTVNAETHTVTTEGGCGSKRLIHMYAPSISWDHCDYASGSQKITEKKGSTWPLNDKTEFQYAFTGKYTDDLGQPWRSIWKCKVDRQIKVKVPAGEFDTYKLVCEDDWLMRTYWISPELGHFVALEEKSKIYISRWYMLELVRVNRP
jgi:hypothetical protein